MGGHLSSFYDKPIRALIVTDFPELGQRVLELLEERGRIASHVVGSKESLLLLGQESFDLILIDADLTQIPAPQVAEAARSMVPGSCLAVIVGWWDQRPAEMGTLCDFFINKPIRKSQLTDIFQGLFSFYPLHGVVDQNLERKALGEEKEDAVA